MTPALLANMRVVRCIEPVFPENFERGLQQPKLCRFAFFEALFSDRPYRHPQDIVL
jgi:hypothetical protein